jgi:cephalosporin hydroxylase
MDRPSQILLLGCTLFGGGDALGFLGRLQKATVHCVDVGMQAAIDELQQHPRARFHFGNAYDHGIALEFARQTPELRFDLIVDDCEHTASKQALAFHIYSHLLSPGENYVIEDVAELSVEDAEGMARQRGLSFRHVDLTHIKGRCDDIIYWFSKPLVPAGIACGAKHDQQRPPV